MTHTLIAERGDESIRLVLGDSITATGDFGEKVLALIPDDEYGFHGRYRAREGMGAELLGTAPLPSTEAANTLTRALDEDALTQRRAFPEVGPYEDTVRAALALGIPPVPDRRLTPLPVLIDDSGPPPLML